MLPIRRISSEDCFGNLIAERESVRIIAWNIVKSDTRILTSFVTEYSRMVVTKMTETWLI